ncbi:hypothetical protein NG799_28175 [Laspinema sp. D1]|uniref:Transposase n=1 Tax=Laspinema palackyanum D2a TaxID=2953684 RepID=A0ABT2MZK1_9CYAN|nr:hypothetical protein [Laspinema sp. D2a]
MFLPYFAECGLKYLLASIARGKGDRLLSYFFRHLPALQSFPPVGVVKLYSGLKWG